LEVYTIVRGTSVPDLLGRAGYGSINGAQTLVIRIGGATAPFCIALAWDRIRSYGPIVEVLLAMGVVAALSYIAAVHMAGRHVQSRTFKRWRRMFAVPPRNHGAAVRSSKTAASVLAPAVWSKRVRMQENRWRKWKVVFQTIQNVIDSDVANLPSRMPIEALWSEKDIRHEPFPFWGRRCAWFRMICVRDDTLFRIQVAPVVWRRFDAYYPTLRMPEDKLMDVLRSFCTITLIALS
jgi:hypothetical protein